MLPGGPCLVDELPRVAYDGCERGLRRGGVGVAQGTENVPRVGQGLGGRGPQQAEAFDDRRPQRVAPGGQDTGVQGDQAQTPRFAARLRDLVAARPHLAGASPKVAVHRTYVEHLSTDRRYDVIVSGLPPTNFTPVQVDRIMARYIELLHPGGVLTHFAYLGSRTARALTASRAEARRPVRWSRVTSSPTAPTGSWAVDCAPDGRGGVSPTPRGGTPSR
ncbi:hypothetical protein ACWEJP_03670 [Streptomyces sp. NPDC004749]